MEEFCPNIPYPAWAMCATASLAIIIAIAGFLGNLLTILALPFTKRLRNAATYFVVNLAVAEMLFCLTILPLSAAQLIHLLNTCKKLYTQRACEVFVFIRYVNIQAELFSIAAIAINRCILIAIPKKYPSLFSTRKTIAILVVIWVIPFSIMLVPLTGTWGDFGYNNITHECDFDDSTEFGSSPRKVYLGLGFFVPCTLIVVSYVYIFIKARQSARKLQISSNKSENLRPAAGLRQREMRIARTIAVIFVVFLICCLPVTLVHYYDTTGKYPTLLLLLHPLYWLQYCLNLFIYVFMNTQYRDAYVEYISHLWPKFRSIIDRFYLPDEESTVSHASKNSHVSNRVRLSARPPSVDSRFNRENSLVQFKDDCCVSTNPKDSAVD